MLNQFDRFSENAKMTLVNAQELARAGGSSVVDTDHILLGMLLVKNSAATDLLNSVAVTFDAAKETSEVLSGLSGVVRIGGLSADAQRLLELAMGTASQFASPYVGTEHMLYAILMLSGSKAAKILTDNKADFDYLKNELEGILEDPQEEIAPPSALAPEMGFSSMGPKNRGKSKSKTPVLDGFATDLTKMAKDGRLDPVIGREAEISRVVSILNRRTKNNPVLIGEPGVGKTAIVEGLAQQIADEVVPEVLIEKKIMMLDLASVIAGTKYRGEFEDRLKRIIKELKENPDIIVFIDELHTIVGAGAAEGAIDAANIFKPALSRGEIQVIGATTLDEYRKYIEKDSALERRFQPVTVPEPSVEETIRVLKGIAPKYEEYHSVRITPAAIEAAAKLSKRYIADRFLPDKAIDLLDEAASLLKVSKGAVSKNVRNLEKNLREVKNQKEDAVLAQEYAKAAEYKQQEDTLEKELEKVRKKEGFANGLKIDEENIAQVISNTTGIPITRLIEKEQVSLLKLEQKLKKRIVGQDEPIKEISSAIRRARTGISDEKRPIGSFIFLGPTGVGKTELAKALAAQMFGDEDALIKIDMSEFMEKHNVARLVGAPAGYVGYEEGGQLTEKVRRKPYAVILFDEIEKAHPDVFNMMLQILEDGYLTDAKGRRVDFRNTVVIMTSNIGSADFYEEKEIGFTKGFSKRKMKELQKDIEDKVGGELKKMFRPEFLNRIDKVIVFRALTKADVKKIVNKELKKVQTRLGEQKIKLSVTEQAKSLLVDKGYDVENGARPLKRTIQNMIEDPLANGILKGEFKKGNEVSVVKEGENLRLVSLKRKAKVAIR
ncbi:MAG: ATP-dependent Clp protease ATP-binding subunit [Patescibacteria group bacterium]|nr:ATP-dependent Clp protease ATP-binding subunit [Patescibacteria group bacterium]